MPRNQEMTRLHADVELLAVDAEYASQVNVCLENGLPISYWRAGMLYSSKTIPMRDQARAGLQGGLARDIKP